MARALALTAALVLLAAPSASALTKPTGELVAGSEETVLRLHDLPPGYQIGDDSGCGPLGLPEGSSDRLASRYSRWVVEHWPEGCDHQYEQLFEAPGLVPAPPQVEATTVNTPSEAVAARGFKLLSALLMRSEKGENRGTVSIPPSGIPARLFRSRDVLVEGRGQPGSFLFWRFGKLVSVVGVAGMSPLRNDQAVLHFAQIQQRRIEAPTPYTEVERDDTEVRLDDPGLKFPIYWVGNPFQLSGRPPVELESAYTGDVGPPGEKYQLDYDLLEADGFQIGGWTRRSWKRFQRSALGKVNRPAPCTQTTEVELDLGRAVIYGSYDRKSPRSCPGGAPDRYFAIAYIGRMVIGIDLGNCLSCPPGTRSGPYASVPGMRAIVRALELRPKPVY